MLLGKAFTTRAIYTESRTMTTKHQLYGRNKGSTVWAYMAPIFVGLALSAFYNQ